ncbi:hypothetical protein QAD02_004023 [Eretmocerus hayati]|uniref:Uncharacterized protein n=1 Tax=Eretmocerus hayati TaxID=131215 RepID=A0ACC2NPG7_9HYME|nr:hypothetical protein QAD02_004023 [Eretmocerus hayati]
MYVTDKVVIVTGGLKGIGFAITQQLLRNGAKYVAIFDLFDAKDAIVNRVMESLKREFHPGNFGYYQCNVANATEFTASYEKVEALKKYVDILINNAGICNENKLDEMIAVNFTAVVHGTMMAVSRMDINRSGKGGTIINVGCIFGLINEPAHPLYNATKHAVVSYVRSLKENNSEFGVRILCMCPGMTETEFASADNFDEILPNFVNQDAIQKHMMTFNIYMQKPESVAVGIIEMLEKAKEGEVWVAQKDHPPFPVEDFGNVENLITA